MTYKQAYDKIIDAYFKDEIKPYNVNFCFCGTLAPDERELQPCGNRYKYWDILFLSKAEHPYSIDEYAQMEYALLTRLGAEVIEIGTADTGIEEGEDGYEDSLFDGMCAALEVLKQIHKDRGENVDDVPVFTKRVLAAN